MATTDWVQKAGMSSATEVDNIETLVEQAETAETNAAASETAAAASATAAASSATSASASATSASTSASGASASETAAAASETAAATSESNAASSASAASTSASNAATSESNASTSETNAATSASNASTSATNAATSATNAETAYDNFDDRYLGDKASDPALDNDGDALVTGALYYNTALDAMKVYNGSAWQDVAPVATSLTVSQISDLTATAAELNYVDGVTSAIQTQLDAKGTVSTLTDLGVTATAAELNTLDGLDLSTFMLKSADSTLDMNNNNIVGVNQIVHEDDPDTYMEFQNANQWRVVTAGTEKIEVNTSYVLVSSALVVNDIVVANGGINVNGSVQEKIGFPGTLIDPDNGSLQVKTLTANTTFTHSFSNGKSVTLMIDDGAGYTVTWPTIAWVNGGGTAPTLATTGYTVVVLWYISGTLYGALVGDGS